MAKKTGKATETTASRSGNYRYSVFNRTPLQSFFDSGVDICKDFDAMASVFESASGEALGFSFSVAPKQRFMRRQPLKYVIIKTLLFVGVDTRGKCFPVLARLIEILVVHPDIDLNDVIDDFAQTHHMSVGTVTRMIDNGLNMRDQETYDRVTTLTRSHPFTAKDALCDLAVYINTYN